MLARIRYRWLAVLGGAAAIAVGCATAPGLGGRVATADFVGSERCGGCHVSEYKTWKETWHAKMVRTAKDGLMKDAGDAWAKDAKGTAGPTKGNVDGKPFAMKDVLYVVGSLWKQRFLVRNEATGNHQFMDKQWNSVHKQWEPYGQRNDWETQCVTCHVTGFRMVSYDDKNVAAQKVTFTERNIGCEACHGPGSSHASSLGKAKMFNPAKASKEEASLVCGYCHIRKENYLFSTAQGNHREDQPHPVIGQSYKAGQDDWRTWYPAKMLIPGILPNQPMSQDYPETDLANAFFFDEKAKAADRFDARKHHQEYQDYVQSSHAKNGLLSCSDCHSPHAVKNKPAINAKATCSNCHGAQYNVDAVMPGLASTAQNLFVRSHTFYGKQDRKSGPLQTNRADPAYFYR